MNACYQWLVVAGLLASASLAVGEPAAESRNATGQSAIDAHPHELPLAGVATEEQALAGVEGEVGRCRTARQLVLGTKLILSVGGPQSAMAEPWVSEWEERAARGEVRIKNQWVLPQVAAQAAHEANVIIRDAHTDVSFNDYKGLMSKLKRASDADPFCGRAEFLKGIASIFFARGEIDAASRCFLEVVAREPNNGAAFNNLAICECILNRFDKARAHFELSRRSFVDEEVFARNVAYVSAQLKARYNKSIATDLEKFQKLQGARPIDAPQAWQFLDPLGLILTPEKPFWFQELCKLEVGPARVVQVGFVIATQTLLTPALGSTAGSAITVRTSDEPPLVLSATVIATSQSLGISLLRCEDLQVDHAPLAERGAAVGDKITTFTARLVGSGEDAPPSTSGTIVATNIMPGLFAYAAANPPGNAGVPLIDASGRVVGLGTSYPRLIRSGTTYAIGQNIDRLWPFLGDHLPNLKPGKGDERSTAKTLAHRIVLVIADRMTAPHQ
jgi:tetratricopeptide (TPR) repeat protein